MSNLEKQMQRLLSKPKDYTFSEASSLLCALGFELQKGKNLRQPGKILPKIRWAPDQSASS